MTQLALIFVAGGIGCVSRYLLATWAQRAWRGSFPAGTLCVNLVGCFCAGLLAAALARKLITREEWRLAAGFGFLGGFTTFSAFGYETFALLEAGQIGRALGNILLSVGLGVVLVWAGFRAMAAWFPS